MRGMIKNKTFVVFVFLCIFSFDFTGRGFQAHPTPTPFQPDNQLLLVGSSRVAQYHIHLFRRLGAGFLLALSNTVSTNCTMVKTPPMVAMRRINKCVRGTTLGRTSTAKGYIS